MRTLRPADYRVMPWKNGLGATTELVVEPPGAALDAFDWRLSIAELRASGPFSSFAGYDRVIAQLDGPPMTLTHEGRPPVRLEARVPHAFSGDEATSCEVGGVAHDFNLMVRREFARASLTAVTLEAGASLPSEPAAITVIYVLEGALDAPGVPTLYAGDTRIEAPGGKVPHVARVRTGLLHAAILTKGTHARAVGGHTP